MSHALNIARLKLGGLANRLDGGGAAQAAVTQERLIANRYKVKSLLGQGGMGRVLLAEDVIDRRDVALKITLAPRGAAALDVGFRQEFYTLSKLQHPGTVKVYDYGILPTGERYLTMELVRGRDLRELVARGPLPAKDVYRILTDLGQVLGFIHSRLFVHCDIKSENVRVTDRQATKLMDFGLMVPLGSAGTAIRGTPAYMAPEVARGGVLDARTDIYSLGVLAFELATGRLPFDGQTLTELIAQHLERPPPRPSAIRADLPAALEALILKSLEKDPRQRHQDIGEFLTAVAEASGKRLESAPLAHRASYLNSADLVGRSREVGALGSALEALQRGEGGAVYVSAPAGVGKTRLLQEFLLKTKLADVPTVLGQCRREGLAPLRPLTQALASLLPRTAPQTLEKVAPVLVNATPELARRGIAPKAFSDPLDERAATIQGVVTWLKEVSQDRPLLMVLEDLHWADTATLEVLNALTHELKSMKALVVATFRNDEVDRSGLVYNAVDAGDATLLEIPPLSREDLGGMVQLMLKGVQLPESFYDALYASTRGNCFFATESLRALVEDGALAQVSGKWAVAKSALALPSSIAEAVSQRLATLSPELAQFATVAAVGGRVLDLDALEALSGLQGDALFARLDEMTERQFVTRVDERVMFTHDTVRDTIYRRLPEPERQGLHLRFGEHLERQHAGAHKEHAAQLAHHFAASSDGPRAAKYLLLAGEQAFEVRALIDASKLLISATDRLERIDYPDKDTALIGAWAKIVECTFENIPAIGARYAEKLTNHWRSMIDVHRAARLMRAMMRVINGLPAPMRRGIKRNIYAERPFDAKTRVPFVVLPQMLQYLTLKAFAHGFRNDWADTFRQLDECAGLIPDPESIYCAGTFAVRSLMHGLRGESGACGVAADSAYQIAERNVETVCAHAARVIYGNCLLLGPINQSFAGAPLDQQRIDRAFQVAREHNILMLHFQSRWPMHVRACQTGDQTEWQRARGDLLDVIRRLGYPAFHESRLYFWDPYFLIQQGRHEEALAACVRLERLGNQIEDAASTAQVRAFRAMVALDRREHDKALELVDASLELSRKRELITALRWAPLRAEVLLARGDSAGAASFLEKEVLPFSGSSERGAPIVEVLARRLHGEAVRDAAEIERSLEIARQNGILIQQGFAHLGLARLLVRTDRSAAARHLDAASEIFRRANNPFQVASVSELRTRLTLGVPA